MNGKLELMLCDLGDFSSINSHEQILQSERCVISYEYDHGLREDNVPAIGEQRERLKRN